MGGISIHALREEGDAASDCKGVKNNISIHALREEGDQRGPEITIPMTDFYPRPPRGGRRKSSRHKYPPGNFYPRPPRGGRLRRWHEAAADTVFLSTPSARRATVPTLSQEWMQEDFYPRPPRGGRPPGNSTAGNPAERNFYPRPPRGGRLTLLGCPRFRPYFYPRPPRGGRLCEAWRQTFRSMISIHALREEGDRDGCNECNTDQHFYPRPPRGGRPYKKQSLSTSSKFLSTPSARRATAKTERKLSAFVSLYTSLHKLQRGACKTNRKITPLLTQTAGIPVRSVPENHVRFLFALAGYQKISTLSCANSGCNPTCSTLVW